MALFNSLERILQLTSEAWKSIQMLVDKQQDEAWIGWKWVILEPLCIVILD